MLRRLLAALGIGLLLASVFSCASTSVTTSTPAKDSGLLLPAPADSSEALWGFVGTDGEWVIKPQFQAAMRFREGLAPVKLDDKWGYVDQSGTLVVPAQYTEAHYFNDGLARVATAPPPHPDDHVVVTAADYGFIDKTGKSVIPANWDDAGEFSEGLAPVMKGSKCGFIDTAGQVVIPLKFDMAAPFSEGLAPALSDGKWGYIDRGGVWVIEPTFNGGIGFVGVPDSTFMFGAGRFQGGVAPVGQRVTTYFADGGYGEGLEFHYIDKTGKQAFEGSWGYASDFGEGLAAVDVREPSGDTWSFIDATGKALAVNGDFFVSLDGLILDGSGFHEGLAAVQNDNGVGYIDKTGNFVIPAQFAAAGEFSDGYAYVYTERIPFGGAGVPSTLILQNTRGLEIIDLTGRVIYTAPQASAGGSTTSS